MPLFKHTSTQKSNETGLKIKKGHSALYNGKAFAKQLLLLQTNPSSVDVGSVVAVGRPLDSALGQAHSHHFHIHVPADKSAEVLLIRSAVQAVTAGIEQVLRAGGGVNQTHLVIVVPRAGCFALFGAHTIDESRHPWRRDRIIGQLL